MFVPCFDEAYIKVLLEAQNPTCVQKELYSYRMGQPTMSSSYKNVAHYEEFIRASTQLKMRCFRVDMITITGIVTLNIVKFTIGL